MTKPTKELNKKGYLYFIKSKSNKSKILKGNGDFIMKCKKCGEKFHYCGSCDYDYYGDNGYCSSGCFAKTEKYKEARELFLFLEENIESDLEANSDLYEVLEAITEVFC